MKKIRSVMIIAALAAVLATGCGDSSSTRTGSRTVTEKTVSSSSSTGEKTVRDTDVFEGLWKSGEEKWLGLSRDEISRKSGGEFDKANSMESEDEYDKFYLGEQTAILGGKASIEAKYPVYLFMYYNKDGKLKKLIYSIDPDETVSGADEKPLLEALSKFLEQNVPDGYTKKAGSGAKGKGSFYFFNGQKDGYVFEVSVSSDVGSTNFPVKLSVETYKDKYGQ